MHATKFSLVLLALWAGTAAGAASSCSGESGGGGPGGSGGGGACTIGCGGADADADAAATDGDANDEKDGPGDAPPDVIGDAEPDTADASTGIPCATQAPECPENLTCCDDFCVDIHKDPRNCGGCGVACGGSQFCTGEACSALIVGNVCDNPSATIALDAYPIDNTAGSQVGDGLALRCDPPAALRTLDQSSPLLLNQLTSQPILGPGDTFVAGGGSFGQQGLAYLDAKGYSPLYAATGPTGNLLLIRRTDSAPLVNAPTSSLTDHHDYFAFYVAVEPGSGTLVLTAFGLLGKGTTAAGWYWEDVVAPNLATYDKAWYVYEWTDANNDAMPDSGDTYAVVASAP